MTTTTAAPELAPLAVYPSGPEGRTGAVLADVVAERHRQHDKFGPQNHGLESWLCILTEEVGELAQATLRATRSDPEHHRSHSGSVRDEAVQVAAVAVAIVEALDQTTAPEPALTVDVAQDPAVGYQAVCERCGWVGPGRGYDPEAAHDDAEGHEWACCPPIGRPPVLPEVQRMYWQPARHWFGHGTWWVWVDPHDHTAGDVRWRPWRPGHWLAMWRQWRWTRRWFGHGREDWL